jgi:hypothetical protein
VEVDSTASLELGHLGVGDPDQPPQLPLLEADQPAKGAIHGDGGSPPQLRSERVPQHLRPSVTEIRVLLQRTDDEKVSKERMHLDLETDDIEAEVQRLEALGATRYDHQQERGFDFWILRDPWGNEFCVLHPNFPELLARRRPWIS